MYIIVTYDVGVKRNSKVLKTCRKYLTHVQKSVFEGFVEEKKLGAMKNTLAKIINPDTDQIAIYKCHKNGLIEKEIIGYHITTDNIV